MYSIRQGAQICFMIPSLLLRLQAAAALDPVAEGLAHFEQDGPSGQNEYLLSGLGVLSFPGVVPSDLEGAESPDFDLLSPNERLGHGIEEGIYGDAHISIRKMPHALPQTCDQFRSRHGNLILQSRNQISSTRQSKFEMES